MTHSKSGCFINESTTDEYVAGDEGELLGRMVTGPDQSEYVLCCELV